MLELNSKHIKTFLESKLEEITQIIRNNATKTPDNIAKAIVQNLDYSRLPISLLSKKRGN